jgi:predicted Fe-Mo cluster-binding NifX family protein
MSVPPTPDTRDDLPASIGRPAVRALNAAGIASLREVSRLREVDLVPMHGVGPRALSLLRDALAAEGLSFRQER